MFSSGLPVLNVADLSQHWPKWQQYFEIYVLAAYNNQLADRQKLALFLHFLGPDGLEIVNRWFPELKNINSTSAMQITFEEVWNTLHVHCQYTLEVDHEPNKKSSVKEDDQERVIPAVTDAQDLINVVDIFLKLKQDHQVRRVMRFTGG